MPSRTPASIVMRYGIGWLFALAMFSCGSATPSDLLLPHQVEMTDSDANVGAAPADASSEAKITPVPEADTPIDAQSSPDTSVCGATTCGSGCCDEGGTCQQGTDDMVCGAGGSACSDCTTSSQVCMGGMCSAATPPEDAGCNAMTCPRCSVGFYRTPCCNAMGACACGTGLFCP